MNDCYQETFLQFTASKNTSKLTVQPGALPAQPGDCLPSAELHRDRDGGDHVDPTVMHVMRESCRDLKEMRK